MQAAWYTRLFRAVFVAVAFIVILLAVVVAWGIRRAGIAENHLQNIFQVAEAIQVYLDRRQAMPESWNDLQTTGCLRKRAGWVDAEESVVILWPIDGAAIASARASTAQRISSRPPSYDYSGALTALDAAITASLHLQLPRPPER